MTTNDIIGALELAGTAYAPIQPRGQTRLVTIDDAPSGVQCFLRREEELLRVTFRGSDSPTDWRHNFQFCKKCIPYDNANTSIRVHTGFLNAYKAPQVRRRIQDMVSANVRKIQVSGHSLGAALAILCALDLQYNFPDRDIECIVFGCPRVGNAAFRDSYNKRVFKTIRVENGNDIVTKVPLWLMGYRHVGVRITVGAPRLPGMVTFRSHDPRRYYQSLLCHCFEG